MSGKLLVLEGTDGSGKATQVKILKEHLESKGSRVLALSYPDYTYIYGRIIDDFLHSRVNLDVEEQFFVYLVDMLKDKHKVRGAIAAGDFVIMDRYLFSTLSYQCSNGFDYERAKSFIRLMELNEPFAVFYVDVPVEISMQRKQKQKTLIGDVDKFEKDRALLQNVKGIYERLISEKFFSKNWVRIDGSNDQHVVADQILSELAKLEGKKI